MKKLILITISVFLLTGCMFNEQEIKEKASNVSREVKKQLKKENINLTEEKNKIIASSSLGEDGIKKAILMLKDNKVISEINEVSFINEEKTNQYYEKIRNNENFKNLKKEGNKITYETINSKYESLNKEELKKEIENVVKNN